MNFHYISRIKTGSDVHKKHIEIDYTELASREELGKEDLELLEKAEQAREKAYSPYSKFKVGAALVLENGKIFTGNNQENASFPVGLCAERVALFAAHSRYPGQAIKTLVVTASGSKKVLETPVTPCGSCRQVFAEFENEQQQSMKIILASGEGKILVFDNSESLLPLSFFSDQLNQ